MPIRIHHGDILAADAECLLLTTSPDSTATLSDESADRLLGNLGHQFRRRFPDAWSSALELLRREAGSLESLASGSLLAVPKAARLDVDLQLWVLDEVTARQLSAMLEAV